MYWELYESFHKGDLDYKNFNSHLEANFNPTNHLDDYNNDEYNNNNTNNNINDEYNNNIDVNNDSNRTTTDADEVLESASQCGLSRKSEKTGDCCCFCYVLVACLLYVACFYTYLHPSALFFLIIVFLFSKIFQSNKSK